MTTLSTSRTGLSFRFPVTDDDLHNIDPCNTEVAEGFSRDDLEYPAVVRRLASLLSDLAGDAGSPVQITMDYIDGGDGFGCIDGITVALSVKAAGGVYSPLRLLSETRPLDDLCLRSQTGRDLLNAVIRGIGEMGNSLLDEFGPTGRTYVHH